MAEDGPAREMDDQIGIPAKLTSTELTRADLVLADDVLLEVDKIVAWLKHSRTILQESGPSRSLKPGYRSLFHGPPGTGKTLTATLIGAEARADVYRIDLSMVTPKYIGETEKNLDRLFDRAAQEDWILFFDEADALFGRRTEITSSHDRYANQEVSYLLQRMEDFPGLVILSANFKGNLDEAFVRRFQSVVSFPLPDAQQRLRLWENILVADGRVANDVDLEEIAQSYELSGGAITNAVRYGAVSALQQDRDRMGHDDLVEGIRNELRKEGRTL